MNSIGQSHQRIDALDKVTGKAEYSGDISAPDQLHLKILFAGRPHAIVKSIETQQAAALDGVLLVLTAADVPVNEYGLQINDQPVLCGPGSKIPYADRVRFIGDQVAAVVAETEEIASAACGLIQVEYEDLLTVLDPHQAAEEGALLLHPESNIYESYRIRKGDVIKAFQEADLIIESEYHTPVQEHAYLQPEAGFAYYDEQDRITVAAGGQWAHEEQEEIAHSLGVELDQVRVIHPAIGGAFGGREDLSVQIVLGLSVLRLRERGINRPVKIVWSREESIIGHHKRHAYHIKTRWGATREGILTAAEVEITADGGAYMYTSNKVLMNATINCTGPYEIPNVKVDSRAVATNKVPGGAFRGFGGPQGAFAAESQMNKLAEALDMDPVEIRLKNALKKESLSSLQSPLPGLVNVSDVLERCAEESYWKKDGSDWVMDQKDPIADGKINKRGIGFACGLKNIGFSGGYQENSWATVEIHGATEIEEVIVRHAAAEVGQGTHTVIIQMAADAVGVSADKVRLISADTGETNDSGSVSASRMTFMAGNSVRGAGTKALEMWKDEERPAVVTYQYLAPKTTKFDPDTGESTPNFAYGYVAQAVEVIVDTETGQITVENIISTHDVGKAINPDQVVGQIEGGVIQALGYVLTENFIQEDGYVKTDKLSTYLIPTVQDVPKTLKSVVMENADPNGPWGALGMAEMPYIPLAPAVTAAVHDAIGIWFDDFPLTPERVLRGMGKI